jgi:hypothetical protein
LAGGVCGQSIKRVFVTSTVYTAAMGGVAGANAKCQARATAAGFAGTFKAWLSDSQGNSPKVNFTRGGPYQLTDGSVLAANWTALTTNGGQKHAFNITELNTAAPAGGAPCGASGVWSATNDDGTATSWSAGMCGDWTNTTSVGSMWGTSAQATWFSGWCSGGNTAAITCATASPLFCFQQ